MLELDATKHQIAISRCAAKCSKPTSQNIKSRKTGAHPKAHQEKRKTNKQPQITITGGPPGDAKKITTAKQKASKHDNRRPARRHKKGPKKMKTL